MEKDSVDLNSRSTEMKNNSAEMRSAAEKAEKYIRKAMDMGADHAVFFRTGDIEF